MFGLGFTEILLLILIAFLIFGPQQFPTVMKNFIKILNELKSAFTEVKSEFYDVQTEADKQFHQIKDKLEEEFKLIEEPKKEQAPDKEPKTKDSTEKK
ncbi:MAG: twin-arginine translocase TatA/TatE family subunit [Oligoflexia bacterium]|nr:twin-arginine translocase TatA/TatE family subunit [Oligoflexia bacterium]